MKSDDPRNKLSETIKSIADILGNIRAISGSLSALVASVAGAKWYGRLQFLVPIFAGSSRKSVEAL